MKIKKILRKRRGNWYVFVLAIIFLVIIPSLRFFVMDSIMIGQESYYHLRIAGQITKTGIPVYDQMSDSNYALNPLHLLLALFVYLIGEKITAIVFPFLLGILSLYFFMKILEKLNLDPIKKIFTLIMLFVSPIFLYTFSTINSFSFPIFLMLLGFYFFIKESKINFYLSILIFAIIPFFGLFNLLITIILLLFYSIFEKTKMKNFYFVTFVLLLISLVYSSPFVYPFFFPKELIFNLNVLKNILYELGAVPGFSIFIILLAIIGFLQIRSEEKRKNFIIIFLLLVSSFFITNIIFYLNFLLIISVAEGLLALIRMRWKVKLIKKLSLIIIIIGLLISSFSSIILISSLQPSEKILDSLNWLKSNSKDNEKVLSHFSNSFWIQKIAERPTFIDPTLKNNPLYDPLFNTTDIIFYSRNIDITTSLLNKNNITYIWIDKDMKNQKVWTKPDQGLLFLLENSKIFKKVYDRDSIEIWKFDS